MMIVDINNSESDTDIMIVMTMIMILLPSDNCTVCTQYYYNKYHLYNNNFIVRVVKGKSPKNTRCAPASSPTNHFCLRGSHRTTKPGRSQRKPWSVVSKVP